MISHTSGCFVERYSEDTLNYLPIFKTFTSLFLFFFFKAEATIEDCDEIVRKRLLVVACDVAPMFSNHTCGEKNYC